MIALPTPPDIPGVHWRPPHKSDAAGIVALQDACFEVDGGYREVESEIIDRWESDYCDPDEDALIAVADSGAVIATSWSYIPTIAVTKWRAFEDNWVHPRHRGHSLEEFVLQWWEARSTQRFLDRQDAHERWLWQGVYDWQREKITFLESRGYEARRYFDELGRDLALPIAEHSLAEGLSLRTWETAPLSDSLSVHNASFADHWGSQPISEKSWDNGVNEFSLPRASFVAYDGDQPVSYLSASAFPHDFEDKGRSEAWIEGLGTIRSHRKRGIASALVTRAMEVFRISGLEFAMIGVDSANPTGAYHVYESLGFVRDRRNIAYIKVVE